MEFGFKLYFPEKTVFIPASSITEERTESLSTFHTKVENIHITWRFERCPGYTIITLAAKSNEPLGLSRVDTLCISPFSYKETDRVVLFSNRWSRSGNRYPCELGEGREYSADCTGLFPGLSESGCAVAVAAPFANPSSVCAARKGHAVEFCAKTEFTEGMQTACSFVSDRVILAENVTIDDFYNIYRDMLPQSTFPMPKLTGWNTWDYYLDRVTPEDIFENIEALRKMPFADKLNYIVLDDGWQKDWGVWTENEKFACGLAHVACRIANAGFCAGIWMAPLLMKDTCEGFASRTDWFLKDETGAYAREIYDTYILDPTHPDARTFILDNYKYLYSCGYRLFKIDYLSALLPVKNFYDKTATPYSALSKLIAEIQECTGPDAVILGCSLPIQCGANIAPAMRIGVDIHNHFSHVEWIAESLSWTWMYNSRVTRIDPDFMVVRGAETSNEPLTWETGTPKYAAPKRYCEMKDEDVFECRWRNGDQFNAIEAETWANLVAITGGNMFLSDRIAALNEKGVAVLDRAFAMASEEGRPYYLPEDRRLPSLWQSDDALLLINWENAPVTKDIACPYQVIADKKYRLKNGKLTVTLMPHESFFAKIQ